ncbi:PE-PPE domain-containing protein [Mycobacterium sp.]|uniref:PE-PPE domain-containing protein n=1 Tax=Mycobacterium sp. TaxID=1785 RepID=UPI003BB0C64D
MGLGMVATAGAGVLSLAAMMNSSYAHADTEDDIGLVMGGSGLPIPGPTYVGAADALYLNNPGIPHGPLYPDITFYQATSTDPGSPGFFGNGLFTPEGLYPLTGVHTLELNYPSDANGFPSGSTSVGQGMQILESTIAAEQNAGETPIVFGYSQSSTISSYVMQQLDPTGAQHTGALDPQFLLLGDPSNPNGGLLSRFDGFTLSSGHVVSDPLSLPALGVSFDSFTPADDYVTNIYSLEYDGFTDFPRYPLNFLSDLNAFLGIATIHGTYLNAGIDGSGPTGGEIAGATLLPGSLADGATDSLTNYYMIGETAPLVALLPTPLQELLGPDLTYLINLGYGDGTLGYSVDAGSPADINTPFGLFPDVSVKDVFTTLIADTKEGFQNLINGVDPYASTLDPGSAGQSIAEAMAAVHAGLAADPSGALTDLINALTSASSAAYSALLPTADIINSLVTSMPAYDVSLFTETLANGGGLLDALGLPLAADTALVTLAGGFEFEVLQNTISEIAAAFSSAF